MEFPESERIDLPLWIRAKLFLNPVTNIPWRRPWKNYCLIDKGFVKMANFSKSKNKFKFKFKFKYVYLLTPRALPKRWR